MTLRGVDLLGNEVFQAIRTNGDGSYKFNDLLSGQYVLTEFQPMYLIDGMDTIDAMNVRIAGKRPRPMAPSR